MKSYIRWSLLLIVFSTLFTILAFYLVKGLNEKQDDIRSKDQILEIQAHERLNLPKHLLIPAIKLSAKIQYVGIGADGEMETPNNTVDVGWFELGPRPGETGSTVIAGHFNGNDGKPGVFSDLSKLTEGDKLYIEDDMGEFVTFVVRLIRTYDPGYADDVFNSYDGPHLNLITCDGVWDEDTKSYSKRLVVFADIAK